MPVYPRIPFRPGAAGCGASSRSWSGAFRAREATVVEAGTRIDRRTRWLAFACSMHLACLTDPHPLTNEDRAELAWRWEQERRALAGLQFERPRPIAPGR